MEVLNRDSDTGLSGLDVDRFSVGGFGDLCFQKRAWCHQTLVAHPASCILELGGGLRPGKISFGRFLRSPGNPPCK